LALALYPTAMPNEKEPMLYTRLYDQILTEIEIGNVHDGINLLVGMLDAVGLQPGGLDNARRELGSHGLRQMLLEDPIFANAQAFPDHPDCRINMISSNRSNEDISSTGRRIFEATNGLTFARALQQRQLCFDQKLALALQQGQQICLLVNDAGEARERLDSKVTIEQIGSAPASLSGAARYDLILSAELGDKMDGHALATLLKMMRGCLRVDGNIVFASLLPQHIGSGWRSTCLNWEPNCHDELSLASIAAACGFTICTYRDETDCAVWSECKIAANG
jgi:hypothetical protein